MQDVTPKLIESKRYWTWKQLLKFAHDIASFEFGVASKDESVRSPLDILMGNIEFGYCPPHRDDIYQAKKKDGVLKEREILR